MFLQGSLQDSSPILVQNGTLGRSQAAGWKAFRTGFLSWRVGESDEKGA